MEVKIPFTSLKLQFGVVSENAQSFQEKHARLEDLSYEATKRQLFDGIHSMILRVDAELEIIKPWIMNGDALPSVLHLLENNSFKQVDIDRAMAKAVKGYAQSVLYGWKISDHRTVGVPLIKALYDAGAELSPGMIKRVFKAEDRLGLTSCLEYFVQEGIIDEAQSVAYARAAKSGTVKSLMAFNYGAHIYQATDKLEWSPR